jgi:hypothetical protein
MEPIILNQIDNVLLRIIIGAAGSFIGGMCVLIVGNWITKQKTGLGISQIAKLMIMNIK